MEDIRGKLAMVATVIATVTFPNGTESIGKCCPERYILESKELEFYMKKIQKKGKGVTLLIYSHTCILDGMEWVL
ncbi:hypothetical protein HN51_050460 [Arachis hypogaea]